MDTRIWIDGLVHEDFAVRNTAIAVLNDIKLPEPDLLQATEQAMVAIEKWGWDGAFEFPHQLNKLPHTEESVRWAIEQLLEGKSNVRAMAPLHLLCWIATAGSKVSESQQEELRQLHHELTAHSTWGADELVFKQDLSWATAADCEKTVEELVGKMAQAETYPHKLLEDMEEWCERWVEVASSRELELKASGWLSLIQTCDWEGKDVWHVCVGLELAGRLKLRNQVGQVLMAFGEGSDAWSEIAATALDRMIDEPLLVELMEQFDDLDEVAQLYLSGAVERADVSVLDSVMPLLERNDFYEYECVLPNLANAVVRSGDDALLPKVESYLLSNIDDIEVEAVLETLCVRYQLQDVKHEWVTEQLKKVEYRRKRREESSPLNMLLRNRKRDAQQLNQAYEEEQWNLHPVQQVIAEPIAGRNDPCPCGSGKKYKKCCL